MSTLLSVALILAQATPLPSPASSPTPPSECNHVAEVIKPAYPIPEGNMWDEDQARYATLEVVVGPDGTIGKITVVKSSGSFAFDMASVRAAKRSVFKPKMLDCKPVEGPAMFRTSLTPGTPPP